MRIATAILALLLFCIPAQATVYHRVHEPLATTTGEAISGALYWFYSPGTSDTVAVYSDATGTRSYHGTGFTTGADGMIDRYVEGGTYDIYYSHSGWSLTGTLSNYAYGVASEVSMEGTVEAWAFEAEDAVTAGGAVASATLETSGASALGGTVTTGGTVYIGGGVDVEGGSRFAWDATDEVYSFRITPNAVSIEPLVQMHDDVYVYANVYLFGKDSVSGRLEAQVVKTDSIKPSTGTDLYIRAADGQDDAVLHTQYVVFSPVDITLSLPDTSDVPLGTLFYATDDSFRYMAGDGIAREWRTLGYAGYVAGADNPELDVNRTSIHFTYAEAEGDTSAQTKNIGITNLGAGILATTASESSGFIAAITDTNTTGGATWDSLAIRVLYGFGAGANQVPAGAAYSGTVTITSDYGIEYITVYAAGDPITGQDYVVEPNHPRLFFNEDEIAGIRAKCKSAEATFYNGFIDWVNDYALGDTYPFAYNYQHGQQLRRLAFAYAVEQDTTYLQEAVECADSLFAGFPTTWYDDDDVQTGYSLFYDWCYDGFGATRKSKFGDSLAVMCTRYTASGNFMTNAAHSQAFVLIELVYMGIALDGDGHDDAAATAALDTAYAHTFGNHHMGAILDSIGNDGGGFEGDYSEGEAEAVSTMLWLWDHGTDKDSWAASTNMTGHGDYMLYDTGARTEVVLYDVSGPSQSTLPAFGEGKQGDSEAHGGGLGSRMRLVQRLAAAYQDSTLMWLSNQYDTHTTAYINRPARWKDLVMRDTLMVATAPSATPWPAYTTAKQFDVGTVFMRSGWDLSPASTDIWATYRHEQYPFGHAHADAGHFILGRGHDLLFIDSGEYYNSTSDHHLSYMKQTVAHNAITIKDFGESFRGHENSGGQDMQGLAYSGEHPLTLGAYTDSMAGTDGRGSIVTYAHRADTLTYIKSDLTNAYSSAKVDTVRREFVWMEPDGVFLVFDYADVDSIGFLQKSLFHTINNPTYNGDGTWTAIHGGSEVTLRFLGHASTDEVGGSGAEFEVNGTNYLIPPCVVPSGGGDHHSDNGAYRIEAVMPRDAEQRWLLTIIQTSVVGGADYGTVSTVSVGDYIGAIVNSDTLLFHKYGGAYDYRE